jgi:hypothetical protein
MVDPRLPSALEHVAETKTTLEEQEGCAEGAPCLEHRDGDEGPPARQWPLCLRDLSKIPAVHQGKVRSPILGQLRREAVRAHIVGVCQEI